jgi:hypothetical protein
MLKDRIEIKKKNIDWGKKTSKKTTIELNAIIRGEVQ